MNLKSMCPLVKMGSNLNGSVPQLQAAFKQELLPYRSQSRLLYPSLSFYPSQSIALNSQKI
jgi:hypothetical protein